MNKLIESYIYEMGRKCCQGGIDIYVILEYLLNIQM